jgi:hypothetical protein
VTGPTFGSLDFVYAPSVDVVADARWFTDVLGAELVFAIESSGIRVALVRLGSDAPPILLTDHLPDARPVFIYRVDDLAATTADLEDRGWSPERTIELPPGACTTFLAPGGLRLAIYERSRPGVMDSFTRRRDF